MVNEGLGIEEAIANAQNEMVENMKPDIEGFAVLNYGNVFLKIVSLDLVKCHLI